MRYPGTGGARAADGGNPVGPRRIDAEADAHGRSVRGDRVAPSVAVVGVAGFSVHDRSAGQTNCLTNSARIRSIGGCLSRG